MRVLFVLTMWIAMMLPPAAVAGDFATWAGDFAASRALEGGFTDGVSARAGPDGTTLTLEVLKGQFVLTRYDVWLEPIWRVNLEGGSDPNAPWPLIHWHRWKVTTGEVRVFVRRHDELLLQRIQMETGVLSIEVLQKVDAQGSARVEPVSLMRIHSSAAERSHESLMFISSPSWRYLVVGVAGTSNKKLHIYDGSTLSRIRTVVGEHRGRPANIRILDDGSLVMLVRHDDGRLTLVHQQHGLATRRIALDGVGTGQGFPPVVVHGNESVSVLVRPRPAELQVLRVSLVDGVVQSRATLSAQTIQNGLGARSKRRWKSISFYAHRPLDNGDLLLGVRSYSADTGYELSRNGQGLTSVPYARFRAGDMVWARMDGDGTVLWMSELKSSTISEWRDGVYMGAHVQGDALRVVFRKARELQVAHLDLGNGSITGPTSVAGGLGSTALTPAATVAGADGGWVVALRRVPNINNRYTVRSLVRVEGTHRDPSP